MRTIHKYPLEPLVSQKISMPAYAEVLCAQFQESTDTPCLWVLCDPELPYEFRTFLQFGTGAGVTGMDNKYIGTYQNGSLVFHVFEAMQ